MRPNGYQFSFTDGKEDITMPYMTAEEAAEWGKTLSFEKVWAALMETRAAIEEDRKKAAEEGLKRAEEDRKRAEEDRKAAEEGRKRAEALEKSMAALHEEVEKTTRNINGLSDSVGDLMQKMVATRLWDKFQALGYEFTQGSECRKFTQGKRVLAEADVFLENGIYVMAVEVKTKLRLDDIDEHLERMDVISQFLRKRGDPRKLLGAVAGGIVAENALHYAQKKGFYVITQNGDAVDIVESPAHFKPRQW
jgi:hypothetical protein